MEQVRIILHTLLHCHKQEEEEEIPIHYYGKGRGGTTVNDELILLDIKLICDCAWPGQMSNWHFQNWLISITHLPVDGFSSVMV